MAGYELAEDGAWSVHQRPRAIFRGGKTFVGSVTSGGDIAVTQYHHSDGTARTKRIFANGADDHASPALYIRDDGRILVASANYAGDSASIYYVLSDNPLDVGSWGSVGKFTSPTGQIGYPQPLPWNGNIRMYHRTGKNGWAWVYRVSADGGNTWGSEQDVLHFGENWQYVHPYRDGSRIHFANGDHRLPDPSIRHWYLEGGDYYTTDGSLIQSENNALTNPNDITTVFDASATGNSPAKTYDIKTDENGNPYITFIEHVDTGSGGGDGDYRARWARWDGSQWIVGSEITPMGGAMAERHYYESGICLDSQDPSTVYISVEQDNRNYQIQEWTTNDDGSTWSKVNDLSSADATITDPTKRGRPVSPRNHNDVLNVAWWIGEYSRYTDYDTQIQSVVDGEILPIASSAIEYIRDGGTWMRTGT